MTAIHEQVWKEASKTLQGMLNPELFNCWFAPIKPIELNKDVLVLGVANEFYQIWLQDNFLPLVREAVNQSSKQPLQVRFTVAHGIKDLAHAPAHGTATDKRATARPALDLKLNSRYTFDTFVVGPNNNFAHAAALAVSQSPGKSYNPLFLYGGVGLGKTHLMQAIGHHAANHGKSLRVCYITCEQLTNEFIQAIQCSTMTKFRKKYRLSDVLLIDDIHFLSGKERIQEE